MNELTLDDDVRKAILALGENFGVLGTMFQTGEGTPEALRMVIASLREAVTIFEAICDQWERADA